MSDIKEFSFTVTKRNLSKVIDTLKDLARLNDNVLFRFDDENILIYSLVGEGSSINAFKSFVYKTKDILSTDRIDVPVIFITRSAKEMVRNLRIMADIDDDVLHGRVYYDMVGDSYLSDRIAFRSGNKLKQSFYGNDPTATNTDITVEKIRNFIHLDEADFSFDLTAEDFDKIKKLATPDAEMNIFYMNTFESDGKYFVSVGEGSWELTVDEVDYSVQRTLAFPKKYFKTISMTDGKAKVYVFDTSLMVSTPESDLLISIEVTV